MSYSNEIAAAQDTIQQNGSGWNAISADHLEYLDEAGTKAMAEHGTVATLLPGAFYFINETQRPPVSLLRAHGVPIALATDLNPGSSPVLAPLLMAKQGSWAMKF